MVFGLYEEDEEDKSVLKWCQWVCFVVFKISF